MPKLTVVPMKTYADSWYDFYIIPNVTLEKAMADLEASVKNLEFSVGWMGSYVYKGRNFRLDIGPEHADLTLAGIDMYYRTFLYKPDSRVPEWLYNRFKGIAESQILLWGLMN